MNKDIDKSTYWLSKFHEGQKLQRQAMSEIKSISIHLKYTFPHIANDLIERYQELKEAEKLISEAINQNMSESLKSSQDFIGSALTGILRACEKESNNEQINWINTISKWKNKISTELMKIMIMYF